MAIITFENIHYHFIFKIYTFIYIRSAKSQDGRFSPSHGSHLHGQIHPLSLHQSSHLHQSSLSGENSSNPRPGFSIQNSFLPNSSISGGIPSVRSMGLLSDEGRSGRLSPTNDLSSKNFLERSLKSMANAAAAASSKEDIKCKYLQILLIFKINVTFILICIYLDLFLLIYRLKISVLIL